MSSLLLKPTFVIVWNFPRINLTHGRSVLTWSSFDGTACRSPKTAAPNERAADRQCRCCWVLPALTLPAPPPLSGPASASNRNVFRRQRTGRRCHGVVGGGLGGCRVMKEGKNKHGVRIWGCGFFIVLTSLQLLPASSTASSNSIIIPNVEKEINTNTWFLKHPLHDKKYTDCILMIWKRVKKK